MDKSLEERLRKLVDVLNDPDYKGDRVEYARKIVAREERRLLRDENYIEQIKDIKVQEYILNHIIDRYKTGAPRIRSR